MNIFNRDAAGKFVMPEDGWFQLAPVGKTLHGERELPGGEVKKIKQRLTPRGLEKMVQTFRTQSAEPNFPGLLIDFEHFSHNPDKSTEAAGWIHALENRTDGLWAQIRLSDLGEAAIRGGRYRGISPVWDGPEVEPGIVEPEVLFDAGLTNKPNLRGMVPLSNRHTPENQQQPNQKDSMKKLIVLLGLAAEASEDAVVAEFEKIRNRASQFDELKPKYDALLESQADADLDAAGIKDEALRKDLRAGLIANREQTLPFLKLAAKPVSPAKDGPLHNRAAARTPGTVAVSEDLRALRNRAVQEFQAINKCEFEQAWNAVRAAKPELFKEDTK
jgi:phage I-like protein